MAGLPSRCSLPFGRVVRHLTLDPSIDYQPIGKNPR